MMRNKRVLISGGGIAGLTLAYWLQQAGFTPVVIEIAPSLRRGGYMIDFWGVGYTVAEKMHILPQLRKEHYEIPEIVFVNKAGKKTGGFHVRKLRKLIHGRHFNFLRSGLEKVLYEQIKDTVDIRFATSIEQIQESPNGVHVSFNHKETETFDLLIGADGLRSNTRRLAFGPDEDYERYLGYDTAAYTIENFTGKQDIFHSYTLPGKQAGVYAVGNNQLNTFFIFKSGSYAAHRSLQEKKEKLARAFEGVAWLTPQLISLMDSADDFYLDAVSQIEMPRWSRGRVALLGDACQAVSLISGQGSALAMAGAYVLAEELKEAGGDYPVAFQAYERKMKPEVTRKQKMARQFAGSFVPSSRTGIVFRNLFTSLMFMPLVSRYFIHLYISDQLELAHEVS